MKEYTNIKADDFCCVGAVFETVLIRNNYTNYSQYAIINEFKHAHYHQHTFGYSTN